MVQTVEPISVDAAALADVCRRFGVQWLAVFGSFAEGKAGPQSDVDLLVRFKPGVEPTYYERFDLAEALSPLFGGRAIDLGTPESLFWYIRRSVMEQAKVLYAA